MGSILGSPYLGKLPYRGILWKSLLVWLLCPCLISQDNSSQRTTGVWRAHPITFVHGSGRGFSRSRVLFWCFAFRVADDRVSKDWGGCPFGGPRNKDCSILGVFIGKPLFMETILFGILEDPWVLKLSVSPSKAERITDILVGYIYRGARRE